MSVFIAAWTTFYFQNCEHIDKGFYLLSAYSLFYNIKSVWGKLHSSKQVVVHTNSNMNRSRDQSTQIFFKTPSFDKIINLLIFDIL